jgi:hypothetical protein
MKYDFEKEYREWLCRRAGRDEPNIITWFLILLLLILLASCVASKAQTNSVTLAWDPVISSNTAGYRVYYGIASRNYTNIASVGNNTNVTIASLADGWTYYFAAITLGQDGINSGFSSEISYTAPCPNCPPPPIIDTNYITAGIYQLCVQTDVVFWPQFVKWTNSLPGWPAPTYFRLLLISNNTWQYQAAHNFKGTDWFGVFGTVKSGRKPALMITNLGRIIVGTNYSTNIDSITTSPSLPNPITK